MPFGVAGICANLASSALVRPGSFGKAPLSGEGSPIFEPELPGPRTFGGRAGDAPPFTADAGGAALFGPGRAVVGVGGDIISFGWTGRTRGLVVPGLALAPAEAGGGVGLMVDDDDLAAASGRVVVVGFFVWSAGSSPSPSA